MHAFELTGYEILEKVGEGGMATVWKARQLSLDRLVAIKTLSASYLPDEEALARFRREAQAAARLNHPGIVQVYDAGEVNGTPYLVMEFVDGATIADLLDRKGKLTEKNALLVAEGVAGALGYAWDKDCIIHCDIKPENVLIESDGSIKVADLGLARFIGLNRRRAADETILGTPNYTSPEQSEGVPDLDCRTDIYSLGAMLYHLATGVLPFAGSVGSSAMEKHQTDYLTDPVELNPELSHAMAWLIEKLMVKNRAYRPPYWSTVLADIHAVREGRFPLAPLPQPGQSTVLRSADREALPPPPDTPARQTRTVKVPAVEGGPRKRMVVVKKDLEEATREAPPSGPSVGRALLNLLIILALAGSVYVFFKMGMMDKIRLRQPAPATPVEPAVPEPASAEDTEPPPMEVEWGQEPAPESGTKDGRVVWENADFQQGAQLYNDALALYEAYQKSRQNPASLSRVEAMAREAITHFDACKALAPPDVDVAGAINDCYHLIADTRHSTLLTPGTTPPRAAEAPPEFTTPAPGALAPSWAPAPAAAPAVAPAAASKPADALTLSPVWNKMPLGPRPLWEDLKSLLQAYGAPAVMLGPDPSITLFQTITYLMPVRQAAQSLGVNMLSFKQVIECPGFPDRSFSYYGLRGHFGQDFDQLLLIVDAADRVVAVQLQNEHPAVVSLEATYFSDGWRAYNFAQSRLKAGKQTRIGHRVTAENRVVRIESELLVGDDPERGVAGKPKEHSALILADPIVSLILARLERAQ